ncbi:MAG: nucleoside monophosphate kinase [Patescibacteria group bacterium]|nr:nucleoside monophosphate kinase [Patescibacteria group bacterium]
MNREFDLISPEGQKEYFAAKAGKEIQKIKEYLEENTFIAYLLGKKNSGKGTYSKMLAQLISPERIEHFSIGDIIRDVDKELADEESKKSLFSFLKRNYRGRLPLEEIISSLENRDTKTLLPTELILVLLKKEIEKVGKKSLFIDGFPRDLNQIDFSLFFRDLIGYRDDPDVFVLIDVPEKVIDERIKWRRVCPACKTSRNLKLLPTSKVGFDEKNNEFYLICDNPNCKEKRMGLKEGDELGIEPIRKRLELDDKLIKQAFSLYGVPKILLRNSIPVKEAENFVDDYEITPEYVFEWDKDNEKVKVKEKPWVVSNDRGVSSYSLLPQPVVVSFIKQLVEVFKL